MNTEQTNETEKKIDPEFDPQITLRSDLWPTMNVSELSRQQEIVIDRMNKLYSMMGALATPSLQNMYGALQVAMNDLSKLIDYRTQQKPQRKQGQ